MGAATDPQATPPRRSPGSWWPHAHSSATTWPRWRSSPGSRYQPMLAGYV